MKKCDIDLISNKLSVLINQPLCSVSRGGGSIFIGFGELVEKDCWYLTEDKKAALKKQLVGKYALHIECGSRFICGDEIIIAKRDMFMPNSEIYNQPDFDWDNFNWDVKGNNYFDELAKQYLSTDSYGFIVNKITVNMFGDLKICFENKFVLELFADISGGEECWRFFEADSEGHLVVSGQGIERDESEAEN